MKPQRKHRFLVGYRGDHQVVYGKRCVHQLDASGVEYTEPMTRFQAERKLKKMPCKGAVIYEIREVRSAQAGKGE